MLSTYFAVPLMISPKRREPGLVLSTVAWDRNRYIGSFYDVSKHATVRFLWGLAKELREHRVATVAVAPGFMRTERVMFYAQGETDWRRCHGWREASHPNISAVQLQRWPATSR